MYTDKTYPKTPLRLDQASLAQEFADKISKGRLAQISEILANDRLTSVEMLFRISGICNRLD